MFDRDNRVYVTNKNPETINIVEKRAPTDESIKILKEMQKEVAESIIERFPFMVFDVRGELIVLREFAIPRKRYVARIKLNGHFINVEMFIDDFAEIKKQQIFEQLFKTIAERISEKFLNNCRIDGEV